MKQWLEEIITDLQSVENPQQKYVSSVCIACVIQECEISFKKKGCVFSLLKMLKVQPENNSCSNISLLLELTPAKFR